MKSVFFNIPADFQIIIPRRKGSFTPIIKHNIKNNFKKIYITNMPEAWGYRQKGNEYILKKVFISLTSIHLIFRKK